MPRKNKKPQPKELEKSAANKGETKSNSQILIAIIGTMGVIMVGLFNFPPFQRLFDSTTTPTSTPLITETARIYPTDSSQMSTSIWTPSPSPIPSPSGITLFEDAFIDNRYGWYTASANPNITGGKYSHKVTCPADYVSYYCGTYLKVPFSFPKNFKLEIDATILESSVNADVGIGFQLRRNGLDHYYINYYITQGYYNFSISYNSSALKIIPDTTSNLIAKGSGFTNRFGIDVVDTIFTPVINGQTLLQGEDGNLPNAGKTYLIIYISRGHSATLQFDNLLVQEVK